MGKKAKRPQPRKTVIIKVFDEGQNAIKVSSINDSFIRWMKQELVLYGRDTRMDMYEWTWDFPSVYKAQDVADWINKEWN